MVAAADGAKQECRRRCAAHTAVKGREVTSAYSCAMGPSNPVGTATAGRVALRVLLRSVVPSTLTDGAPMQVAPCRISATVAVLPNGGPPPDASSVNVACDALTAAPPHAPLRCVRTSAHLGARLAMVAHVPSVCPTRDDSNDEEPEQEERAAAAACLGVARAGVGARGGDLVTPGVLQVDIQPPMPPVGRGPVPAGLPPLL